MDMILILYFAGIVDGMKMALGLSLVPLILVFFCIQVSYSDNPKRFDTPPKVYPYVLSWILLLAAAVTIPNSSTIYLMASFEVGQTLLETPEAAELLSAVKGILMAKLEAMQ